MAVGENRIQCGLVHKIVVATILFHIAKRLGIFSRWLSEKGDTVNVVNRGVGIVTRDYT